MGFIGRILPVFIGWIIWRQTGNIIFGAIVAVVLEALIGPLVNELGLLFVKPAAIKAEGEVPQGYESRGVRIMAGKRKGSSLTADEIITKGLAAMEGNNKFAEMLDFARQNGLPEVAFSCEYDNKNTGVLTKTFREWRKDPDIANMFDSNDFDNRFFSYDEPEGEFFTAWLFSREIPIPEDAGSGAETQDDPVSDEDKQVEAGEGANRQEEARSGRSK